MSTVKKTAAIIIAVCTVACMSITVFAADITYSAPELNLTLSLPDKFIVFTRDSSDLDTIYDVFSIDSENFHEYLEENDIYIDGITEDYLTEFLLVGNSTEDTQKIFDYNLLTEKEFETCKEPLKEAFEENGMEVSDISTYCGKNAKFFVISYSDSEAGQVISGIRYSTVFNGTAISLTLHSGTGTMTEEKSAILKKTVESIEFTKLLDIPESAIRTEKKVNYVLIFAIIGAVCGIGYGLYVALKKKKKTE